MNNYIITFILVFAIYTTFSFAESKPHLQLASTYERKQSIDLTQYYISEKYDGIRAYWNGKNLLTRSGRIIPAPKFFIKSFPPISLDGELWIKRQSFEQVSGLVRRHASLPEQWEIVKYMVFDLPEKSKPFYQRFKKLKGIIHQSNSPYLKLVEQGSVATKEELFTLLDNIIKKGGEGLMLKKKNSFYTTARNNNLIKLKPYQDDEAIVLSYIAGKGKFQGMMGAILVENRQGKKFKIGSGFSDHERKYPPKIGTTITYKYTGFTKYGIPRFATFLQEKPAI